MHLRPHLVAIRIRKTVAVVYGKAIDRDGIVNHAEDALLHQELVHGVPLTVKNADSVLIEDLSRGKAG